MVHKGVVVETNHSQTGTEPFSVLTVNNFSLTISMVKKPGTLPRFSEFRRGNAMINDHLFSEIENNLRKGEPEKYYAILVHAPTRDNKNPDSMELLFPNTDYTRSIHKINLRAFIDFELDREETPKETIETPVPKLRKRLPKKGAM